MIKTDILLYSGSLAAISAALALKAAGKNVLLVTHRNYLGEDICDSLRLKLPEDPDLSLPLAQRLFGEALENGGMIRPMHLKHELDQILAEADIPLMLGSTPAAFEGSSLRVRNRSGEFSLEFQQIIDGSPRGDLLRLAGIPLTPPASSFPVVRRVIGGKDIGNCEWEQEGTLQFPTQDESAWTSAGRVAQKDTRESPLWAGRFEAGLDENSWTGWMKLEQQIRMQAYRPGQELSADGIFALTGEQLATTPADVQGQIENIPAASCGTADGVFWSSSAPVAVDPTTTEKIIRHDHALHFGRHLASLILKTPPSALQAARKASAPSIEVDVLVVGGGTGGAPAAVAAARSGKRTLVAEALSGLGGVGTLGLIGKYWYGNRVGFTAEVDQGAREMTTQVHPDDSWDVEAKMQWYHQEITKAGGQIWYKTVLGRALTEGQRVTGAVLCTPYGEISVKAKCVVDASGAAEVAFSAGAETVAVGEGRLAMQGTGLPGRNPGANYTNTDYDFVDDSNAEDLSSAHITSREKFKQAFDAGQLVDSRERRRIVGDLEVSPMDIRLTRVFPDSLIKAISNFDTHGYTVHPLFMIVPPDHDAQSAFIPLRALLPKGWEGVLVTGLGISAHRDAMPVIRMQADVQNQGYAAGLIAAMAGSGNIRDLDILEIQDALVKKGILDPEIQGADDSFPLPAEEISQGLTASVEDANFIDRVFTLPPSERMQKIREAFANATDERSKAHFAFVLGILDDDSGFDTLKAEVVKSSWDEGWNYTGMGQFGESMSPLDARIIALGRCRNPEALPVLKEKADTLPAEAAFSHYRVLAEALETIGDPQGATILDELLARPGITGHHLQQTGDRLKTASDDSTETRFRNASLIELHLATSLYRLNPEHPTAREVLENYAKDLRGLFSAHAKRVVKQTTA